MDFGKVLDGIKAGGRVSSAGDPTVSASCWSRVSQLAGRAGVAVGGFALAGSLMVGQPAPAQAAGLDDIIGIATAGATIAHAASGQRGGYRVSDPTIGGIDADTAARVIRDVNGGDSGRIARSGGRVLGAVLDDASSPSSRSRNSRGGGGIGW